MSSLLNWNLFEARYDQREQWAFENMAYFLFCSENDCPIGLFRYKNQPGIETEPIEKDGGKLGFQAKYYSSSIKDNKQDIIDSIDKSKSYYPSISTLLFYLNKEFSKSTKTKGDPKYKTEIEQYANSKNIRIEWRVPSQIEFQVAQPKNKWIKDIFFDDIVLDPDFFSQQIEKSLANLGDRYNEKLNFELPIAKLFDSLARRKPFYDRLVKTIDDWLTEKSYRKLTIDSRFHDVENDLEALRKDWTAWVNGLCVSMDEPIELDGFTKRLHAINAKVSSARSELYHDTSKGEKDKQQRDSELYRLREIENKNHDFISKIDELNINLSNNPALIIHGEAGCGKSHLLGDIATQRNNLSLPTILLLGINFNNDTIENNILKLLGLTCGFGDFAKNLNEIGLRMRSRVLIMIDAINEGPGPDLWRDQIAGFIKVLEKYPAIGLVLSIRSTYYKETIPENFRSNTKITIVEHVGFKGNEYEALKMFCENYGLKLPSFPILNPEYSNPLFLHLICSTLKNSDNKTFPTGFSGIRNTLNLYLNCQNSRFEKKRHEYKYRNIVTQATELVAKAIFDAAYERLNINEVNKLFDENFPIFSNLLADLIEEGILIKQLYYSDDKGRPSEYVVFSYQRVGDFCIAEELLNPYQTFNELKQGFKSNPNLCKIKIDNWHYDGLIEALAVLVPEKYNRELFELSGLFIEKTKRNREFEIENQYHILADSLLNSLKWRSIDCIDKNKIIRWMKSHKCIDQDTWLYTVCELSTISNHPFNSDYLHQLLSKISMPIRDSFWQQYLQYYHGYNDYDIAYPVQRLIDWAWLPEISQNTDFETARLSAQALAWVLSSTNNTLRDQATKAMVNLLEQQPEALIFILKAFDKVDDLYVIERLYAVAYGCILRTAKDESITLIANYVFKTIFKNGNPPVHILLRDYARNIIEYAFHRELIKGIDLKLIRPLYSSDIPSFPDTNEVQHYSIDYNAPDFYNNYGPEHNAIYDSLIGGFADFGHYIVETAVNSFSPILINEKKDYESFYSSSNNKTKKLLDDLFKYRSNIVLIRKRRHWSNRFGLNVSPDKMVYIENSLSENCVLELQGVLNEDKYVYLKKTIIPYFDKLAEAVELDAWGARRWIVKRVFELGYNRELHGKYDHFVRQFYYDNEDRIERIGKKYQWIAYHELMARIADNYCMIDRWLDDNIMCYQGPWQLYLRNIDPVYIKRDNSQRTQDITETKKAWWEDDAYSQWNVPDEEWVDTIDDLIPPQSIIQKKDEKGSVWIRLSHHITWKEPKKIGEDRYNGKQICFFVQAFIINKIDKQNLINFLSTKNLFGRWLPENGEHTSLFSREKYWSPAYNGLVNINDSIWSVIRDADFKVIIADEKAKGTVDGDKSGANKNYYIPCSFLFEGLNMQYALTDGELINDRGETIVINKDEDGCLIRQNTLLKFLERNNLDIIWTVLGEKLSTYGTMVGAAYCKVPCGVYYFEEGEIKGSLKMYDRD